MERITNDIQKLFEEAQKEIADFSLDEGESIICSFYEYPSLVGLPFQMVIIRDQDDKMRFSSRSWDRSYDLIRWKEGIYNLDRLRILAKDIHLSEAQLSKLIAIFEKLADTPLPQSVDKKGVIVLDGCSWKLNISWKKMDANYEWRVATEELAIFLPLIECLQSIANQA